MMGRVMFFVKFLSLVSLSTGTGSTPEDDGAVGETPQITSGALRVGIHALEEGTPGAGGNLAHHYG